MVSYHGCLRILVEKNESKKEFQECIVKWYLENGRVFLWRTKELSPWQWLVLELLLKKTRAETVEKNFLRLISKYSEPRTIMHFSQKELENDLKPLGLYRQRALALRKIAETIIDEHCGLIPTDQRTLSEMPHVGLYISSAVACFCYGIRTAVVDSNVARILTRVRGFELPKDAREKWVWNLAEDMLPDAKWKEYNFGLLDLGALICRKLPLCEICPANHSCVHGQNCLKLRGSLKSA